MKTINISPDPSILKVIINNPIDPIQALCELIDNSIDGFNIAEKNGVKLTHKRIYLEIPNKKELEEGQGRLLIRDTGAGMSVSEATNAATAGYSSKRHVVGTLGLYGLGFNISSGKFGRTTTLQTARENDEELSSITIDLEDLSKAKNFDVPISTSRKKSNMVSGTIIEITGWWPHGDRNNGFINKLVGLGKPKIREQLGRIYSTIIREKGVEIILDNEICQAFEHCVWDRKRSVYRNNVKIPAVIDIDESIGIIFQCESCGLLADSLFKNCPECEDENSIKKFEKRIRGWVGIQRFEDSNLYGIDLIRNGRAICRYEKDAFFYIDIDGVKTLDYPVDGTAGRIVGEIHLDFVIPDFMKVDFLRTSVEWIEAIKFLRGETSLQRDRAKAEGLTNSSPIKKLFDGYRKVREYGKADMYMGYWDPISNSSKRISREKLQEFYEKFKQRLPGYYDDAKWWEEVERADDKIGLVGIVTCPNGHQNSVGSEQCFMCDHVFTNKKCINKECGEMIPTNAVTCGKCGTSQIPINVLPQEWACNNCETVNSSSLDNCSNCGEKASAPKKIGVDFLEDNSTIIDDLSILGFSIPLPGGVSMHSINLVTYYTNPGVTILKNKERIPLIKNNDSSDFKVFIDPTHPAFVSYQDRPEDYISIEMAHWLLLNNEDKVNNNNREFWSLSNLYFLIHLNIWKERLELNPEDLKAEIENIFIGISQKVKENDGSNLYQYFDNLDEVDRAEIVKSMYLNHILTEDNDLRSVIETGEFINYMSPIRLVDLIEKFPEFIFDGKVFNTKFTDIPLEEKTKEEVQKQILANTLNLIEDMSNYLMSREPSNSQSLRAGQSLKLTKEDIVSGII